MKGGKDESVGCRGKRKESPYSELSNYFNSILQEVLKRFYTPSPLAPLAPYLSLYAIAAFFTRSMVRMTAGTKIKTIVIAPSTPIYVKLYQNE